MIPICICVVLPCVIVWLVTHARKHEIDKKTELALKAIENGAELNPNFFSKARSSTIKQKVFSMLVAGLILLAIGVAPVIVGLFFISFMPEALWFIICMVSGILIVLGIFFVMLHLIGRRQFSGEIAEEEKSLDKK